jgi:hypothetical protein
MNAPWNDDDDDSRPRYRLLVLTMVVTLTLSALVLFAVVQARTSAAGDGASGKRQFVEDFLAKYAHDPSSVAIQELRFGPTWTEDGHFFQRVFVTYRQRNLFGAMQYHEDLIKMTDGRRLSIGPVEQGLLPSIDARAWATH